MKYLFLDIDGVLNDHSQYSNGYSGIQQDKVLLLNKILDSFEDLYIIISSAWRYMMIGDSMNLMGFDYILKINGINTRGKLLGHTRPDKDINEPRINQILDYLDGQLVESFVILDDLELSHPNQVKTDSMIGLTESDVEKAIQILRRI